MAKRKSADESRERKLKFLGILLILFSVLLLISLITHSGWDDRRIRAQDNPFAIDFRNQVGMVGALTSYLFFFFLGWLAIIIPFVVVIPALRYLKLNWRSNITPVVWFALIAGAFITMMINAYRMEILEDSVGYAGAAGGYFFYHLTKLVVKLIGKSGSIILLGAGVVAAMVVIGYRYPFLRKPVVRSLRIDLDKLRLFIRRMTAGIVTFFRSSLRKRIRKPVEGPYILDSIETEKIDKSEATVQITPSESKEGGYGDRRTERKPKSKILTLKKAETSIGRETKDYVFPGLDLLADNPEAGSVVNADELSFTARALKDTLETFGVTIEGQIEKYPGPVITRFEFKPAAGVKVHQITNLSDDLALALQAKRIRIVAPIPGKAAVGVEIPNRKARIVYIKDIIGSDIFASGRLRLPIALGKTISGKAFVANLSRMPHLLVAGATGSGKSVCINGIITSLIYRLHPRELKFIFIDPKMLELSVYSGIPYLGRPVVTNAKRAEKVLTDAVVEMESRYKKLAADAVRNIDDYNARRKNVEEKMPYIVIVVDELADMMMATTSSRIEMLITRLAQMARAVGIHLILATQRPSVDVITGLIKANFSARLAFQVASKIDSRTIIDTNGAEKLLGNGDMLFLQPGQPEPIRLHGAYISSEETERIVKFIKNQFPDQEKSGTEAGREEEDEARGDNVDLDDPLFIEAAQTVIRHKQGSVSLLQRKLGIGYQRAARLIDSLEEAGIVGPYDGSKAREVLADNAFLEKLMASRSLTDSNSQ